MHDLYYHFFRNKPLLLDTKKEVAGEATSRKKMDYHTHNYLNE